GDAPYYGRFGFTAAKTGALAMPGPFEPARLLGLELSDGALDGARGVIRAATRRPARRSAAAAAGPPAPQAAVPQAPRHLPSAPCERYSCGAAAFASSRLALWRSPMTQWPVHGRITGPIVMIGFGSIGKGTLPLIERHFEYDKARLVVIDPEDKDR